MGITFSMLDRIEDDNARLADESERYWQMYCDAQERAEMLDADNAELERVINVVWDAYSSILPRTREALLNQEPLLRQVIKGD